MSYANLLCFKTRLKSLNIKYIGEKHRSYKFHEMRRPQNQNKYIYSIIIIHFGCWVV